MWASLNRKEIKHVSLKKVPFHYKTKDKLKNKSGPLGKLKRKKTKPTSIQDNPREKKLKMIVIVHTGRSGWTNSVVDSLATSLGI